LPLDINNNNKAVYRDTVSRDCRRHRNHHHHTLRIISITVKISC